MGSSGELLSEQARRRTVQSWGYYLLALTAWVTVVLAMAVLGAFLCSFVTWHASNPLYHLLVLVREYIVLVCMITVLAGWMFISYHFIAKPNLQLQALMDASRRLIQPTSERIFLPSGMQEMENQMNLIREEALRAAQSAREAEQRKNDLIVYLAHDLKTPLTSVIGYLMLLRDEPQISPELRARYTGIALEKAKRLMP